MNDKKMAVWITIFTIIILTTTFMADSIHNQVVVAPVNSRKTVLAMLLEEL